MTKLWKNYMDQFWRSHLAPPIDARVRKMISLCKGKTLDLGCGKGQYMGLLDDCVGIDFSIEGLKTGKGDRILASAQCLPVRDGSFDTVFASELLEHVQDDKQVISEMTRVCKGFIVVSVPNSVNQKAYWNQWAPSPSDHREYTPEKLKECLGDATFHSYTRGDPLKEVWLVASVRNA